jgi:hypothetical protein|tara:strand:+ start:532 stop:1629 length:1098 start_codon:yes stop_codon:yes gene_type:complete
MKNFKFILFALVSSFLLWQCNSASKEDLPLDYGSENSQMRNMETANHSPYAMFGDSSVPLMTEFERVGKHILIIQNDCKECNLSHITIDWQYGIATLRNKKNEIEKLIVIPAEYIGNFLSVDPLIDSFPSINPYNFVMNNPIIYNDPDGRSPVYTADGKYLGMDDNGFTGDIIIMEERTFNNLISKYDELCSDIALKNGNVLDKNTQLAGKAWSKIFTHVSRNTKATLVKRGTDYSPNDIIEMDKLFNGKISVYDPNNTKNNYNTPARGEWGPNTVRMKDGKIKVTAVIHNGKLTEPLTTVENIQNTFNVHEYGGHGIEKWGDKTNNHYKVYEMQMNHPTFQHTTKDYKKWIRGNHKEYLSPSPH